MYLFIQLSVSFFFLGEGETKVRKNERALKTTKKAGRKKKSRRKKNRLKKS